MHRRSLLSASDPGRHTLSFPRGSHVPRLSPMDDVWWAASWRLGVSRRFLPISPVGAGPCSSKLLIATGSACTEKKRTREIERGVERKENGGWGGTLWVVSLKKIPNLQNGPQTSNWLEIKPSIFHFDPKKFSKILI